MGGKNAATLPGNQQAPARPPMHKCGQVGSYGSLCNSGSAYRRDGSKVWERDHIPAKATLYERALKRRKDKRMKPPTKGETACIKSKVMAQGLAVVIPRSAHTAASPTYASKNKALMKSDASSAASLEAAVERDTADMLAHLKTERPDCVGPYKAAMKQIKAKDVDAMIDKINNECQGL